MNKKIVAIFVALGLIFFISGCGGKTYLSEKLFWKASRLAMEKVWKDPTSATKEEFEAAIDAYRQVVITTPGTILAGRSQFLIAQLYLIQKEYAKAREEFLKVVQNYFDNKPLASEAQFAIGFSYEAEGNWEDAEGEYERVYRDFPLTIKGLQSPLYITAHYKNKGASDEMEKGYKTAIGHYKDLVRESPLPEQVLLAQAFLANAYAAQGDWKSAAETLEEMVVQHPDFPNAPISLFNAAMIYKTKLNEPESAHAIFEKFLSQYPQHGLAETVQLQLKNLEGAQKAPEDLDKSPQEPHGEQ